MISYNIKTAAAPDADGVLSLFDKIVSSLPADSFDPGNPCGWVKGVYPQPGDILPDIEAGRTFIAIGTDGSVLGAVTLNNDIPPEYNTVNWHFMRDGERYSVVHRLAVDPDCRGNGLAKALITHAENEARKSGITTLRLDTLTKNAPAQRVYEASGFLQVCDTELDYDDIEGFIFRLYDKDII